MKHFRSIERLDTAILYVLELTSSFSVLLLAFGLIASMANVLTKGTVLTESLFMQQVWAWTQCIAIDASVAGTIMRTFHYRAQGEKVKFVLHGLLSGLLLFTAAIVSNIESVQQTLNVTLEAAYIHVFIPVELLIWIRSLTVVLLIVAHALRHVQIEPQRVIPTSVEQPTHQTPLVLTPELLDALRSALANVTVTEETSQKVLPIPQDEQQANTSEEEGEHETTNYERVKAYLTLHPEASVRDLADALVMSSSTAHKWRNRIRGEQITKF